MVALGVGASNFAAAVGIGLSGSNARFRRRVAVTFTLFEAGAPIVGLALGRGMAGTLGSAGTALGGGLLCAAGVYALVPALRSRRPDPAPDGAAGPGTWHLGGLRSARALAVMAAALSLDNLVVGFALGAQGTSLWTAVTVIGAVSLAVAVAGLELGARLGSVAGEWGDALGAAALVVVGVLIAGGVLGT